MNLDDLHASMQTSEHNLVSIRGDITQIEMNLTNVATISSHSDMRKALDDLLEQQSKILIVFNTVSIAIAVAVLFNTLLINLSERDVELATLRVLGASRWRLAGILTVEHTIIGLLGGFGGVILSGWAAIWLTGFMQNWSFYFLVEYDPMASVILILVVLGAALMTTPFGSWRISRMDLVERVREVAS